MNRCSKNHEEIFYNSSTCPLCAMQADYKALSAEVQKAQVQLDQLVTNVRKREQKYDRNLTQLIERAKRVGL